jgi:hypothetical protein
MGRTTKRKATNDSPKAPPAKKSKSKKEYPIADWLRLRDLLVGHTVSAEHPIERGLLALLLNEKHGMKLYPNSSPANILKQIDDKQNQSSSITEDVDKDKDTVEKPKPQKKKEDREKKDKEEKKDKDTVEKPKPQKKKEDRENVVPIDDLLDLLKPDDVEEKSESSSSEVSEKAPSKEPEKKLDNLLEKLKKIKPVEEIEPELPPSKSKLPIPKTIPQNPNSPEQALGILVPFYLIFLTWSESEFQ